MTVFFQQNPTNLIKTLASNPPKQIIEAINNSSRLLELFYFINTPDEGCISHGSLRTLAQIARRRQRHRTHFVIEKKLKHLLSVCCPAWKCYCFNERAKNLTFGVEFINISNGTGHCRDCLTPKLSVNAVLASRRAAAPPSSQRSGKQSHAPVRGRNYQSASQPSNWGIRLNSVKWHFSAAPDYGLK